MSRTAAAAMMARAGGLRPAPLVHYLQFAEDAGLAQAEVSWQLPQAASEDVQVPENL